VAVGDVVAAVERLAPRLAAAAATPGALSTSLCEWSDR
jgi:hypothetical protein